MALKIDCRGLPCPQPVVKTKKALEENRGSVDVIVDNQAAAENVARYARNLHRTAVIQKQEHDYIIAISPESGAKKTPVQECRKSGGKRTGPLVIVIASETIGRGDDQLGGILIKAFLNTLLAQDQKPDCVVFMNGGVKLTIEQSDNLTEVKKLEQAGIRILVCGTCLDFFHLKEKVRAGAVSNFYEITQLLVMADKVIRL